MTVTILAVDFEHFRSRGQKVKISAEQSMVEKEQSYRTESELFIKRQLSSRDNNSPGNIHSLKVTVK